jgi:hypothetical protein
MMSQDYWDINYTTIHTDPDLDVINQKRAKHACCRIDHERIVSSSCVRAPWRKKRTVPQLWTVLSEEWDGARITWLPSLPACLLIGRIPWILELYVIDFVGSAVIGFLPYSVYRLSS